MEITKENINELVQEKVEVALSHKHSIKEMLNTKIDKREYVMPGFPLGVVGSLVASGGTGKSFFSLQSAMDIALGEGKQYIQNASVLYLPSEDPVLEIYARIQSIVQSKNLSNAQVEKLNNNLCIVDCVGADYDLLDEESITKQVISGIVESQNTILENHIKLIILDTFRRFNSGNENDGGEMAQVLTYLEQLCVKHNCSVLFLHHTNKSAAMTGNVESQGASRGSSVLTDNIRFQMFLQTMSQEQAQSLSLDGQKCISNEERKNFVLFGVSKQNYGAPVENMWMQRGQGGILENIELLPFKSKNKGQSARSAKKYSESEA